MHRFRMHVRLSEKHDLGASCYKHRGHVDTVWDTKQVYNRTTLKSKYVTIHWVNRWNHFLDFQLTIIFLRVLCANIIKKYMVDFCLQNGRWVTMVTTRPGLPYTMYGLVEGAIGRRRSNITWFTGIAEWTGLVFQRVRGKLSTSPADVDEDSIEFVRK